MSSGITSRKEIIKKISETFKDALIISSAGMISRELYDVNDSPRNFYMQGSMGCALAFGLGLALNQDRDVVVLAGDGEALMSLGTLVLLNKLELRSKLYLCILDNNEYQTTGGQPTCSDAVDFNDITVCNVFNVYTGYKPSPRIDISHKEIAERFYEEINGCKPFN